MHDGMDDDYPSERDSVPCDALDAKSTKYLEFDANLVSEMGSAVSPQHS